MQQETCNCRSRISGLDFEDVFMPLRELDAQTRKQLSYIQTELQLHSNSRLVWHDNHNIHTVDPFGNPLSSLHTPCTRRFFPPDFRNDGREMDWRKGLALQSFIPGGDCSRPCKFGSNCELFSEHLNPSLRPWLYKTRLLCGYPVQPLSRASCVAIKPWKKSGGEGGSFAVIARWKEERWYMIRAIFQKNKPSSSKYCRTSCGFCRVVCFQA